VFCTTVVKPYLILITEIKGIELPVTEDDNIISSKRNNIIIAIETSAISTTSATGATGPVKSVKYKRERPHKYLINIYIADLNKPDITVFVQDESEYY
jgi:hypothetical protein